MRGERAAERDDSGFTLEIGPLSLSVCGGEEEELSLPLSLYAYVEVGSKEHLPPLIPTHTWISA